MINVNTIFDVNGERVIPVRAVPYVTGGDISALAMAGLLRDPQHRISAYVLGSSGRTSKILPKTWTQYEDCLRKLEDPVRGASLRDKLETLPASTYVNLDDLLSAYVELYLPDRSDLGSYTPAERENFQLQTNANIQKHLIDLVFEGFPQVDPGIASVAQPAATAANTCGAGSSVRPQTFSKAQEDAILEALKTLNFTPELLPKRKRGTPWVKSQIKRDLGNKGMWTGTTVFDKAWERLRADGRIAESK